MTTAVHKVGPSATKTPSLSVLLEQLEPTVHPVRKWVGTYFGDKKRQRQFVRLR